MVIGVMFFSLVCDELFVIMEQVEQGFEQFIVEWQNGSLLQYVVECL